MSTSENPDFILLVYFLEFYRVKECCIFEETLMALSSPWNWAGVGGSHMRIIILPTTVSGEVHKERGGDEEVHGVGESDKRACRARAGCNGVCKGKESDNGPLEVRESSNGVLKARESGNGVLEVRESCNRVLKGRESGDGVHEARESNNEVKENDNEVRESGNEVKESSNEVKESSNKAHKRRVMVNGNNIHMKMVSSDRKAGKD